ncbi:RidA family protein [Cupriavidus necator]
MTPEERLAELGFEIPAALPPNGTYIPYRLLGNTLYLSGHGPRLPDNSYRLGRLDSDEQVPAGYADAQLAALNMLATIKLAVGELLRFTKNMTTDLGLARFISNGLIGDTRRVEEAVRRCNEEALASWSDAVGWQATSRGGIGRGGSPTNGVHVESSAR